MILIDKRNGIYHPKGKDVDIGGTKPSVLNKSWFKRF